MTYYVTECGNLLGITDKVDNKRDPKAIISQYEREKVKTRVLMRRLKVLEKQTGTENVHLIWYGLNKNSDNQTETSVDTTANNTKLVTQSTTLKRNSITRKSANQSIQTDDNLAAEKNKEAIKLLNKAKLYRSHIQDMKEQMDSMKKVQRHFSTY